MAAFLLTLKPDVSIANKDGMTALHYAAKSNLTDICRALVVAKAEVNCVDRREFTPLHVAALAGHTATCDFLANNCKADIFVSPQHPTILYYTILYNEKNIGSYLCGCFGRRNRIVGRRPLS